MVQAFRIAIRDEGEWVNAYYAAPDTMAGALLMASVRRTVLDANHPEGLALLQLLLQKSASRLVVEFTGTEPAKWTTNPAPENERTKAGTH